MAAETIRAFGGRPEVHRPREGYPVVHGVFPLAEAAEAHSTLEERRQYGKLILAP